MAVSKWFDANVYMNNKLAQVKADDAAGNWTMDKVVAAFSEAGFKGAEGAEAHFMQFGQNEDVAPNAFFNATEYYRAKAAEVYNKQDNPKSVTDAEAAFVKAAIKGLGMGAWGHYDAFGSSEGVNPSNGFDTEKYMLAKMDALNANLADGQTAYKIEGVYAAFKAAGISALEHFMEFGGAGKGEVADAYKGTIPAAFSVNPEKQVNGGGTESGVTYTLTEGVDKASADIFIAEGTGAGGNTPTLNAADVLQGSGAENVLKIYGADAGAANFVSANISNIQKVIAYGTNALDVSVNKDVEEVWAGQGTNSTITANLTQKVGVQGKISTAAQVFTFAGATGTNDSATVALDSAEIITTTNALTIADVENFTMELAGTNKIPQLQAVAMKTLTVSGTGSLETIINDLTVAATKQLTKIDASLAKGDVKITLAATADMADSFTLNGGEGNDVFDLDQANASGIKFTANLGKGDDKIMLHTDVAANTVIDGGEGNNTLVMTGYTSAASDKDLFKNFQNIELVDGTSYTYGHIKGIENFSAKTGTVAIADLKENAAVTAAGALASLTMDVKDTTDPANTLTLKLDNGLEGKAGGEGAVVGLLVTNTDVLNINSVGNIASGATATENKIILSGASLTGLDKVVIQESSTQGFHLDAGAATVLTFIDGSKSSADLTIDFDSAVGTALTHTSYTIKTGSGNDTIKGSAAANGDNNITAGNINAGVGGDDITLGTQSNSGVKHVVVYTSAADSKFDATGVAGVAGEGTMDKITDFDASNDKIDVSAIAGLTSAKGFGAALTASAASLEAVLASIEANGFGGKAAVAVKYSDSAQTVVFFDADGNGKFTADADLAIQLVGDLTAIATGDISWATA